MRIRTILATAAVGFIAAGSAPAFAAGNEQTGVTVGNCISDGLYGNEPNPADGTPGGPAEQEPGDNAGNVLATQSAGPFVTDRNTGEVSRGWSVGEWRQNGVDVNTICKGLVR